jgi:hypothetical protein
MHLLNIRQMEFCCWQLQTIASYNKNHKLDNSPDSAEIE